jgi:hypothetical protein
MATGVRDPSVASGGTGLTGRPIATGFAFTVLVALGLLIILRHLFGSIRLEVGAR